MKNKPVSLMICTFFLMLVFCRTTVMAEDILKDLKYPALRDLVIPETEEVILDNGMILFLLEDHEFPFINMTALTRTGAIFDPEDKVGLAGLCGTVMRTGGSEKMSGDDMDEMLENIAASVETSISLTEGRATLFTLNEHIDAVLEAFAGVLMRPAFPEDKIELAKVEQRTFISRRNDNPGGIAEREFGNIIYGKGNPYSRYPEYDHINAISRDDLIAFHKRFYHPDTTMIAVCGDFSTSEIIRKIKKAFDGWEKSTEPMPNPPDVLYDFKSDVNLVIKRDVNQANIYLGHIGGLKSNPDFFTITVMNNVFGQGFSSRLFRHIRSDLGLAYHVEGAYECNYSYPGEFSIFMQTKSASTVQAIRAIQQEIRKLTSEEVTDKELEVAKNTFLNSFVFNFDSKVEIVDRMLEYQYYGYPRDFLTQMKSGIERVTTADVLKIAQKYLKPDSLHILAVGNPDDFDEPLSVFGEVREIDITIPSQSKETLPEATAESRAKGKEIFMKMASSLGGPENFSAVKSMIVRSKITLTTPDGPMGMEFEQTLLFPDRAATVIKMPFGEIKQYVTAKEAWVDFNGIQDLPESKWEEMKATLFRHLVNLCTFAESHTAQYLGEEEINGIPTDVILVSDTEGRQVKIYVARDTGYPVWQVYDATIQTGPATLTKISSDFREVQGGILFPFHEEVLADGQPYADSEITELEVNPKVDEGIFQKPE